MNSLTIVRVPANDMPEVKNIDNSLKALQELVGGNIEITSFDEGVLLVCNEEGRIHNLPINENYPYIRGDFLLISDEIGEDGEMIGLSDSVAKVLQEKINNGEYANI